MIHFIKQKLLHKKWMVVSLLIGNIFVDCHCLQQSNVSRSGTAENIVLKTG